MSGSWKEKKIDPGRFSRHFEAFRRQQQSSFVCILHTLHFAYKTALLLPSTVFPCLFCVSRHQCRYPAAPFQRSPFSEVQDVLVGNAQHIPDPPELRQLYVLPSPFNLHKGFPRDRNLPELQLCHHFRLADPSRFPEPPYITSNRFPIAEDYFLLFFKSPVIPAVHKFPAPETFTISA